MMTIVPGMGTIYSVFERSAGIESDESLIESSIWFLIDVGSGGNGNKAKPLFRLTKQYTNNALEFTVRPLVDGLGRLKNQKIFSGTAKLIEEGGTKILSFNLNIPKELGGNGIGSSIFENALEYFKGKGNVDAIEGLWVVNKKLYKDLPGAMSDNLKTYKDALGKGLSESEAAFETFTGKMAKRAGFTKAEIQQSVENGVRFLFKKE